MRVGVLEREEGVGGTVRHYPRKKLIMTGPLLIPGYGRVRKRELLKEEIISLWEEVVASTGLLVETGTAVTGIRPRPAGGFEVTSTRGDHRARRVILAIGRDNAKFVSLACINVVVGANAGGAFSPFGDITTLMVWQKGVVPFWAFFDLFVPSVVNFLVPAALMHFSVPDLRPETSSVRVHMKRGARRIIALFLLTIVTAVAYHNFLNLPPVVGMLTGLGYLQFFGFFLRHTHGRWHEANRNHPASLEDTLPFDVFNKVARAEWDTLLFFYGVVLCVGGLGFIGYVAQAS